MPLHIDTAACLIKCLLLPSFPTALLALLSLQHALTATSSAKASRSNQLEWKAKIDRTIGDLALKHDTLRMRRSRFFCIHITDVDGIEEDEPADGAVLIGLQNIITDQVYLGTKAMIPNFSMPDQLVKGITMATVSSSFLKA